ncbi:MAG: hypothetical protein QGI78_03815 [Phycisphaerales bacterium]|nr:hypothetical protein [Phycisphaerales bacterium]
MGIFFWQRSTQNVLISAAEIDQRMNLHDRIASAITFGGENNAYATVLVEDALATVEKENVSQTLRKFFPVTCGFLWIWIGVLAVVFCAIVLSPQWNLFQNNQEHSHVVAVTDRVDIEASVDAIVEDLQSDASLSDVLSEEIAALDAAANLDVEATELRRESLRKMTDLQRRLDNLLNDKNALAYKETLRRLQTLELPRNEQTTKLAAALKNGNFSKAKEEIQSLQEKLESDQLSAEERAQLEESLKKLGEQLSELTKSNEALANALSAAGMDPSLSNDNLAAANAINGNKKLSEAQKKKLLEMLQAQKQASAQCKKLGNSCKNCANGNASDFQSMAEAADQLQAMKMFMAKAEAAKSQCQKAGSLMCNKPGNGVGQGTGGSGRGSGGKNTSIETETSHVASRSPVHTVEGSIIARQLFEGGLITAGETSSSVRETVLTHKRSAQEAIAQEEVPRQYHDVLRHYFGQLEQLTESSNADNESSEE